MKVIRIYKDNDDKEWAIVKFSQKGDWDNMWKPKIDELARLLQLIYEIEDNKYRVNETRAKGREMVRDFVNRSLDGEDVRRLAEEYKIPNISEKEKFEEFNTSEL